MWNKDGIVITILVHQSRAYMDRNGVSRGNTAHRANGFRDRIVRQLKGSQLGGHITTELETNGGLFDKSVFKITGTRVISVTS